MIISFLNMNDECSGCFLSFQNKTCSLLILTSAFSCVRELTDCEERGEPSISSCANIDQPPCIYTSMYMQIYIYLHVSLPPCICKYICANIYLPPCLFSPMYMQIYMCKYRSTSMYIYLHVYAELLLTIFPNVPKVTRLQKLRCFFKFSKKSKVTRF